MLGRPRADAVGLLMMVALPLGSVMYSTGVVAIFIPVALRIARNTGMSPAQVLTPKQGLRVIALERARPRGAGLVGPGPATELAEGDTLLIDRSLTANAAENGSPIDGQGRCARLGLERLPLSGLYFTDRAQSIGMAEVMLPAASRLVGRTLDAAGLDPPRGLIAVGLRRGASVLGGARLADTPLAPGDTLLLVGAWSAIAHLRGEEHDIVTTGLPREFDEVLSAADRAPHAILALAVTVGIALAADGLVGLLGSASPYLILGALFLMTLTHSLFVVPAATAVLMAPLAMAVAAEVGASPYPFAIIVALAASSAFMTPVVPANAMVGTLGGYRFGDYAVKGLPLVVLVMALNLSLVPWRYPF